MAIAYVEHPISVDEKKKYRKDFDKIIDIKFKPEKLEEGDKCFKKDKEEKSLSASDIVKLIKAAESVEQISEYSEDDRKTVKEAYEEKLAELSAE